MTEAPWRKTTFRVRDHIVNSFREDFHGLWVHTLAGWDHFTTVDWGVISSVKDFIWSKTWRRPSGVSWIFRQLTLPPSQERSGRKRFQFSEKYTFGTFESRRGKRSDGKDPSRNLSKNADITISQWINPRNCSLSDSPSSQKLRRSHPEVVLPLCRLWTLDTKRCVHHRESEDFSLIRHWRKADVTLGSTNVVGSTAYVGNESISHRRLPRTGDKNRDTQHTCVTCTCSLSRKDTEESLRTEGLDPQTRDG